ncbi:hypothetical protein OENI_120014 [Oenococcus oeni]|uniref:Uncharacterized protein n=1 Tax=Oenococcus oeni TaxID=1247 RepID=A0AAQ2UWM4_OENOE|nr:hypothetical protein OENI_120014 [Oenococcus oeni]SYW06640.1 hypothetical protein OENI_320009 [Oenococcus oeni]VDB98447.1 protein of unknown function [Oenococcus oeni]
MRVFGWKYKYFRLTKCLYTITDAGEFLFEHLYGKVLIINSNFNNYKNFLIKEKSLLPK